MLPAKIIAGDTLSLSIAAGDYTAGVLYLENTAASISVAGTLTGSAIEFKANAATTGAYSAGKYFASVRLNDGTVYETVETGWVEVVLDPAAAGNTDRRPWQRKVLDALEATILGKASQDQLSLSIAGRSLSRMSPSELMDWRDRLRREVAVEEAGSASGFGRFARVRLAG
ncbi:MAG: hypothetical protein IPI06_14020 [Gammaproteobacteria bacterium]|nr:hypothetical protein [Gammaproteobacteria bacterium]